MTKEAIVVEILRVADSHALGNDSAEMRNEDAHTLYQRRDYDFAVRAALASLRYSVGVFHDAYGQALRLEREYWDARAIDTRLGR